MTILDRYLGRTVAGAAATVMVFLLAAFTFFAFLDELNDVGRGSYTVLKAAQYVTLRVPALAYQLFPVAALIGALLGLGALVSNSEMVAIRAAGVSLVRTVLAVTKAGLLLTVIAVLVGELLVPWSEHLARNLRSVALTDQVTLKTRNGFWARDGNSFINVRTILPGDRVGDIYIYEFDEADRLRVATYAREARYESDQWLLTDIEQTTFAEDHIEVRRIGRAAWESLLKPELIDMVVIDPGALAMWDLVHYIRYLRANAQSSLRYEQALWSKLVYPLATAAMVLLAIPLVFSRARLLGVGARVLLGSLIGVVFHLLNQASGHLGVVLDLDPALSVLAPTALLIVAALTLLRRAARGPAGPRGSA